MLRSLFVALCTVLSPLTVMANPLVYEGADGIGAGTHLVFMASDHEYRGEETCPALARILAKHHGFRCTVLFGLDEEGHIAAGASNVPGMEALDSADGLIIFARFLDLPDEQMQPLANYLARGGPVVGLRTSSHAFKIDDQSKTFARFDFRYSGDEWKNGFGEQILGNTWVGHYGSNHKQGTRIELVPEQKDHVILQGVEDNAFTYAGAYNGEPGPDFTVLTMSQPLTALHPDADADPKKPAVASTWTRHYTTDDGRQARVFHSTQGASEDILDASYRRLLINGILWSVGLEQEITPDLNIAFVGPYQPNAFQFGGCVQRVKPSDLAGFESPIMPNGDEHRPAKPVPQRRTSVE